MDCQLGAYLIATDGLSLEAMYRTMTLFLQKKVKREKYGWAPAADEFADQCRYQELVIRAEQSPRIEARKDTEKDEYDEEHHARVLGKLRLLNRHFKGDGSATAELQQMFPHIEIARDATASNEDPA